MVEVKKKPIQRIDMALLPDPQKILPLVKGPKCSSDEEKYFCASIPSIFMLWFGTIKLDKNIVIVAEGQSYLQRAHKYLGDVKKGHPNYQNDLFLAALNLWVKDNVPDTLKSLENTKDYFFTLFFVTDNKDEPAYLGGAAFVPDSLLRLKQDLSEQNFKAAEKNGAVEFSFALDYFRLL